MRGRALTTGSIPSLSWSLAWPVMLSIFFQTLYQLVDAFWVSRVSDSAVLHRVRRDVGIRAEVGAT